jgi:hypothetical protein
MCCGSGNVVLIQQYERTAEHRREAVSHPAEEKLYYCKVCGDTAYYPFICCGEKMRRVKRPAEVLRPA